MAKEYFTSKNLPYTEYDVVANPAKGQEMVQKTGQYGVPVIEIDGTVVVGFDKPKIDQLISAAK